MSSNPGNKRRSKKSKNSRFMRNAKGFAKKGLHGRGSVIDDSQFSYFIGILDAMKGDSVTGVEEKVNLANNVFEQTNGQEIHLASNQVVSKALENLLGFTSENNLEQYFEVFGENFRLVCEDSFASHVLQKTVEIAFLRCVRKEDEIKHEQVDDDDDDDDACNGPPAKKQMKLELTDDVTYNWETEFSSSHREKCKAFVLRIGKYLLNNLEEFLWNHYASHIVRTAISYLAGMYSPKKIFEKNGSDLSKNSTVYKVPSEWHEVMKEYAERLAMWPQFSDLPYKETSSATLGVICMALKVVDKKMLKTFSNSLLCKALIDENKSDTKELPSVFKSQPAVFILEKLISLSGKSLLKRIYSELFKGHVASLAQGQYTNFTVQRLLQHIRNTEDFEEVFNELSPCIEDLLRAGFTGVVEALAAACLRLASKQALMVNAMQTALQIAGDHEKSKQFLRCLLALKPYEVAMSDQSGHVNLHGSLIAQHILNFNKPIVFVNCILDTPAQELLRIFTTPNGSFICDAFLKSKFIGEKSRERLIRHLEAFYVDLAINRSGSRIIEMFFETAQENQKNRIMKTLADNHNQLTSTKFGRIVDKNLRVETYRLSASQWRAGLNKKQSKAAALFKDIIN